MAALKLCDAEGESSETSHVCNVFTSPLVHRHLRRLLHHTHLLLQKQGYYEAVYQC